MERHNAIILHGGAGDISRLSQDTMDALSRSMDNIAKRGFEALREKNAVEGVQEAVKSLEDSGLFNAGIGSVLTLSGDIEMDAAIMDGRSLSCGAVGAIRNVRNPIMVARKVLDETDHSLLVGSMAEKFAKRFGLASKILPTAERRIKWELMLKNPPKYANKNIAPHDTVGAVAIDIYGNIASAVSTGGLWLKLDGRVGDSAVIGAGLYAENEVGGVAASGIGEAIMSVCLSKLAHDFMVQGKPAMKACKTSIDYITAKKGHDTAGLIAIDANGNFGYALNAKTMIIAKLRDDMDRPMVEVLRGSTPPR